MDTDLLDLLDLFRFEKLQLDSRKQRAHRFEEVRSKMVDQSSPLTERQVLVTPFSCFVVLLRWWRRRCFVGRYRHVILLVLLFRMIDCTGCCCAFFEERRKWLGNLPASLRTH